MRFLLPFLAASSILFVLSTSLRADAELINNGHFDSGKTAWYMDAINGAKGTFTVDTEADGKSAAHIVVPEAADVDYHIQLFQKDLELKAGQTYHFSFRARASQKVNIGLNMMAAQAPWTNLWKQNIDLGTDWQTFSFDVTPTAAAANARVTFTRLGAQQAEYWFSDVSVTTK